LVLRRAADASAYAARHSAYDYMITFDYCLLSGTLMIKIDDAATTHTDGVRA